MFANFTNTIPFVSTFQSVPRFGYLQDITLLLRNTVTTTQVQDYVKGILFIPCFILAVFLLWLLASFIFSCCCCGRSGFLGGERFVPQDEKKCCNHARNSRIVLLLSAILIITFAATFSTLGVGNVNSLVSTLNKSLTDYEDLYNRGNTATNQITTQVNQAKVNRDNAITYLSEGQAVCSSTISPYINQLNNSTSLDNFTSDYSLTLEDALNNFKIDTSYVKNNLVLETRYNTGWIIYVVPFVVSFVVFIFVCGTFLAWFGKTTGCIEVFQSCVLLPILFIILLISLSLAIVLGLFNVPLSDVCIAVQNVDPIVKTFNNITKTQPGTLTDKTVRYFLSGCSGNQTDPFAVINTYKSELSNATVLVGNATNFAITNQQNLTTICGIPTSDVTATITALVNLTATLNSLNKSLTDIQNVTSCSTLYQLYDQTVHDGICRYLVNGSGWLFVSTVVISTFIMILITLRSSWKKNADHSELF